jgi:hypothetical protein
MKCKSRCLCKIAGAAVRILTDTRIEELNNNSNRFAKEERYGDRKPTIPGKEFPTMKCFSGFAIVPDRLGLRQAAPIAMS